MVGRVIAILVLVLLSSVAFGSSSGLLRPDSGEMAMLLQDGEQAQISPMFVDMILGDYIIVRDPMAGSVPLAVYVGGAEIRLFSTLLIRGRMATVQSQARRVMIADEIFLYTTKTGAPAPPMSWLDPEVWPYLAQHPQPMAAPIGDEIPGVPDVPIAEAYTPRSAPIGTVASAKIGSTASATASLQSMSLASTPPQFTTGPITLTGKVVSASFPGFFYIEEADRSCGIKIVPESPAQIEAGELVDIAGEVIPSSSSVAECHVLATSVTHSGWSNVPSSVSMPQRMLAGGVFGQQQATYKDTTTTPTVPGAGLNPIGLKVTTYGRLTAPFQEGGNTAWYVNDGSNLKLTTSGGAQTGMKLISWEGCTSPTDQGGSTYSAIGILGAEMDASNLPVPVVRVPCPSLSINITTPPA